MGVGDEKGGKVDVYIIWMYISESKCEYIQNIQRPIAVTTKSVTPIYLVFIFNAVTVY